VDDQAEPRLLGAGRREGEQCEGDHEGQQGTNQEDLLGHGGIIPHGRVGLGDNGPIEEKVMHTRVLTWALVLLLGLPAGVAAAGDDEEPGFMPDEFETYSLILLRKGDAWTAESTPEADQLQTDHLAHLEAMWHTGKLVVAGPFDEQDDDSFRGLCLYRAPLGEARALAEADPAVRAGRLRVDAMTWWTGKGQLAFPNLPVTRVTGTARDAKGGAVIVGDDGNVVYVEALDSWPDEVHGQRVVATGRLVDKQYLPEARVSKDGAISQGTSGGDQTVLENASWELEEPGGER